MRHHHLRRVLGLLVAIAVVALALPVAELRLAGGISSDLNAAAAHATAPHPHVALTPGSRGLSALGQAEQTLLAIVVVGWLVSAAAHGVLPRWRPCESVRAPGRRRRALLQSYLN